MGVEIEAAFEEMVQDYLRLKTDESMSAVDRNRALTKAATKLDGYYWDRVSSIVTKMVRAGKEKLVFSKDDRLLVDTGFLDPRLIDGDPQRLKGHLYGELYTEARKNYMYFSEWLAERFRAQLTLEELEGPSAEASALKEQVGKEATQLARLKAARKTLLGRIIPLFQGLPGVPPAVVDIICSGRLDEHLEQASLEFLSKRDPKLLEEGKKFLQLKRSVMAKVKARVSGSKRAEILDTLSALDKKIWSESQAAYQKQVKLQQLEPEAPKKSRTVQLDDRVSYIQGEIRLARTNRMLGTIAAGIRQTYSVLFTDEARITKEELGALVEHVKSCDAGFLASPNVLIAPFRGTGFFEWDRDTLFVPMVPVREKEEAIVDAVVSYRMLADTRYTEGRLKKAFEASFPEMDFRQVFTKEYKNWVTKIGHGKRVAMDAKVYDWFKKNVGPNPDKIIAPPHILTYSPAEDLKKLKEHRAKIKAEEAGFEDYYELAVIHWKRKEYLDAAQAMNQAVQLNPSDGRSLFSLALLLLTLDRREKGKRTLQECVNIAQNTLWQVYAWELLERLGGTG